LTAREEKLGDDENQALIAHARKGKKNKEVHSQKVSRVTKDTKVSKGLLKLQMLHFPEDGTHCSKLSTLKRLGQKRKV
jgi:hypothetical protein